MIVVQKRLHQDDLIGRLRDEGGWDYLEMPGECERQVFDLGDGEAWVFNPGDLGVRAWYGRDIKVNFSRNFNWLNL